MTENTTNIISWMMVCAVVIAVLAVGGYLIVKGMENDLILKEACMEQGGVISYAGACTWSKGAK